MQEGIENRELRKIIRKKMLIFFPTSYQFFLVVHEWFEPLEVFHKKKLGNLPVFNPNLSRLNFLLHTIPILGHSWFNWPNFGTFLVHTLPILGRSWFILSQFWDVPGSYWPNFGTFLVRTVPILGCFWFILAQIWDVTGSY